MAQAFALAGGVLFCVVALIEVLFFRGTQLALFHFSVVQNILHWMIGASGGIASWGWGRAALWYARVFGALCVVVGLLGFFIPGWTKGIPGFGVNMLYGVLYLSFGIAGLCIGFLNKRF